MRAVCVIPYLCLFFLKELYPESEMTECSLSFWPPSCCLFSSCFVFVVAAVFLLSCQLCTSANSPDPRDSDAE